MKLRFSIMTFAMVVAVFGSLADAEARISCNGGYQIVRGQGEIATPYCEDQYIASVARRYGIRVSGSAVRRNPHRKEEICKAIGHDSRIYEYCLKYRSEGCSGLKC